MVVEHKRPLIETQARAALYDLPAHARPKIIGKVDEQGHTLLSELGSLSVAQKLLFNPVDSLLEKLGLHIAEADVKVTEATCGSAGLVY